ncbi:MAG: DUF4012 domain-containing protein [Rhodoglobus sp.]
MSVANAAPRHIERGRHRDTPPAPKKTRRWVIIGIASLLVVAFGYVGVRGLIVMNELTAAKAMLPQVTEQAKAFDLVALGESTTALAGHAERAAAAADDPVWKAFEFVPLLGPNLNAARLVSNALNSLVSEVVQPAIKTVGEIDPSKRNPDGGFDLSPLADASDIMQRATVIVPEVTESLGTINRSFVLPQISGPLNDLDGQLASVGGMLGDAANMLDFAVGYLGVNEPRTYILMVQNNAESTGLGGSAASYLAMKVSSGNIEVVDQASSANFENRTPVDVTVDESALDVFGPYLVSHGNTMTSRPDFPTAAQLTSAMWQRDRGLVADGVISIDPLALARILKATGPITLPSGDVLDSDNAVRLLLNEIYFRYQDEIALTDAFFAQSATAIMDAVKAGSFDPKLMVSALVDSMNTGSIMAWSAKPEEQALLNGNRLQGVLPVTNEPDTILGVYFRDVSASKIDYYLETATQLTSTICDAPNAPTFTTTVTLHSTLTQEMNNSLPFWVRSENFGDFFVTEVFVYGPIGASVAGLDQGGASSARGSADLGRPVGIFSVALAPGETKQVSVTFQGAEGVYGPIQVRGTPMINTTALSVEPTSCQ